MEMSNEVRELLEAVADDFNSTGCEGCGTISIKTINKVLTALGRDLEDDS